MPRTLTNILSRWNHALYPLEPYVGLCGGNFLKPKAKNKFHRRKPTYIYYWFFQHADNKRYCIVEGSIPFDHFRFLTGFPGPVIGGNVESRLWDIVCNLEHGLLRARVRDPYLPDGERCWKTLWVWGSIRAGIEVPSHRDPWRGPRYFASGEYWAR